MMHFIKNFRALSVVLFALMMLFCVQSQLLGAECECCVKIPFSLGNGLPLGNPDAIPNSDGSFGTFVIATPGYYILQNSQQMQITGATVDNPNVSISIESSDVYLDLCNQVLTGSGNLTAPLSPQPAPQGGIQNDTRVDTAIGINVNPNFDNLDNITIANGKLQYYSLAGINHLNVNNFTLENLEIANTGSVTASFLPTAILGLLGNDVHWNNLRFSNNRFGDAFYISLNNLSITNCTSNGLRGAGINPGPGGIFLADPEYVEFGDSASSLEFIACSNALVENVQINDIQTLATAFSIYFHELGTTDIAIRKINISNVIGVASDTTRFADVTFGYEIRGIAIEAGTVGSIVEDCVVTNIGSNLKNYYTSSFYPVGNNVAAFNIHTCTGVVTRNCTASNIWTSGNITATVVPPSYAGEINFLVSPMLAAGFLRELDTSFRNGFDVIYEGCNATNINGGRGVSNGEASPAYGFFISNVNFPVSPDAPQSDISTLYKGCAAQDVFGSAASAGFAVKYRVPFPANMPPWPVIYENCTAQFDRIHNPNGLSNGFITDNRGNNVVFKNCIATGHTLNGFDLAGFTQEFGNWTEISPDSDGAILPQSTINVMNVAGFPPQGTLLIGGSLVTYTGITACTPPCNFGSFTGVSGGSGTLFAGELVISPNDHKGYAKMVLEDCIANTNSGYGFRLDSTIKQIELDNCKAKNNGIDGFNAGGRDMIFRNCLADLNREQGFSFDAYFPFFAKVATDTDLTDLPIYTSSGYTVQYFPESAGNSYYEYLAFLEYLMFIPNDPTAPLPDFLPINGVQVYPGDIVLVKDETDGTLNGVYQANKDGGFGTGPDPATPCWQLVRVNPWRSPFTVPAGTKILVANSQAPNKKHGAVMYTLQNDVILDVTTPVFTSTRRIQPDPSTIIVENCKMAINGSNGLHNSALDVVVSDNLADRNGGTGFLDDSIGGAQANNNFYIHNRATNNGNGRTSNNFNIDYVKGKNSSVLQKGTLNPPVFPKKTGEANVSLTPGKKAKKHNHSRHHKHHSQRN